MITPARDSRLCENHGENPRAAAVVGAAPARRRSSDHAAVAAVHADAERHCVARRHRPAPQLAEYTT
jgi:hypothetical protein